MIEFVNVSIRAGDFELKDVSFRIETGSYAALMGQTGSGKTTILECLCGLRRVEKGNIILAHRDVTHLRPAERNIGYVPQDGALFHTMTVRQHLMFPLQIRRWPLELQQERIEHLAELLRVTHLLDRYPKGLSGGEAQRVALGRALSFEPTTLVLDEPLSALDDATREKMYDSLKHVRELAPVTALHVTHSIAEAKRLADNVFTIDNGQVDRDGSIRQTNGTAPARPTKASLD